MNPIKITDRKYIFRNNGKLYLILNLFSQPGFHFTLMQIDFNLDHPYYYIFESDEFREILNYALNKYIFDGLIFVHSQNDYQILGSDKKFLTKVYKLNDLEIYLLFKEYIIKKLDVILGLYQEKTVSLNGITHYVYGCNGRDLFTIPYFYYNEYTPHISLIRIDYSKIHFTDIQDYINRFDMVLDKNDIVVNGSTCQSLLSVITSINHHSWWL